MAFKYRVTESTFDNQYRHTGNRLLSEHETPNEAFWALVVAAGNAGALASAETMEHLRWRLVDADYASIFCNGFEITREETK